MHGDKAAFDTLLHAFVDDLSNFQLISSHTPMYEVFHSLFTVAPSLDCVAIYSKSTIAKHFPALKPRLLPSLINAHLHEHFLRLHTALAVMDPVHQSTPSFLNEQVIALADSVATCPPSPLPGSCPPGFRTCRPCKSASVAVYSSLARLPKKAFVLGVVPHPYTVLSFKYQTSEFDPSLILDGRRDDWVMSVTQDIVRGQTGAYQRTQGLKEIVAQPNTVSDSSIRSGIWQIWEDDRWDGVIESQLGFSIDLSLSPGLDTSQASMEALLLTIKKNMLSEKPQVLRDAVESWNLAWTELWYFVRASQDQKVLVEVTGN
jgi:hypothetical protein